MLHLHQNNNNNTHTQNALCSTTININQKAPENTLFFKVTKSGPKGSVEQLVPLSKKKKKYESWWKVSFKNTSQSTWGHLTGMWLERPGLQHDIYSGNILKKNKKYINSAKSYQHSSAFGNWPWNISRSVDVSSFVLAAALTQPAAMAMAAVWYGLGILVARHACPASGYALVHICLASSLASERNAHKLQKHKCFWQAVQREVVKRCFWVCVCVCVWLGWERPVLYV